MAKLTTLEGLNMTDPYVKYGTIVGLALLAYVLYSKQGKLSDQYDDDDAYENKKKCYELYLDVLNKIEEKYGKPDKAKYFTIYFDDENGNTIDKMKLRISQHKAKAKNIHEENFVSIVIGQRESPKYAIAYEEYYYDCNDSIKNIVEEIVEAVELIKKVCEIKHKTKLIIV